MRQDQYLKFQALSEKLADAVLVDVDPSTWSAHGLTASEMTQQQRGDAYWSRKMALSSISVLMRVDSLIGQQQGFGTTPPKPSAPEDEGTQQLDAEIAQAEKDAAKVLERVMSGRKP